MNKSGIKKTPINNKGKAVSIISGLIAIVVFSYFFIQSSYPPSGCISVNEGEQTTDLVAQGNYNPVGTVHFQFNNEGKLTVTITENTGKKLNNAGIVFDNSLTNLLKNYTSGKNIVNGKVSNANEKYITSNIDGEVVFTFKDHSFKKGETYYFIVYCAQGWGDGQGFGPSGLNGKNGFIIPVLFYDCGSTSCNETVTVTSISEIKTVVPINCRESVKTLIITGKEKTDFAEIKFVGGDGNILPNLENVVLENFAGIIPNELFDMYFVIVKGQLTWLKKFDAPKVKGVGNRAFHGCINLTTLSLPNATDIGEDAFASCNKLTNVSLPNATNIGTQAFGVCTSLTTLSLPNAIKIGDHAFVNCTKLEDLSLPNVTTIGDFAFCYCTSLKEISLPGVTNIVRCPFVGMPFTNYTELETITLGSATTAPINWVGDSPSIMYNIPDKQVTLHLGAKTFERDFPSKTSPLYNQIYRGYTFNAIHKIPAGNIETPKINPGDDVVTHTGITLLYNDSHKQPDWVAYMHCKARTVKVIERPKSTTFKVDPKVKNGTAKHDDYTNSGYDRGHLAPCEDMCWSEAAMQESFYCSNISPQVHSFNAGIWIRLENLVRKWVEEYDTLYIATGPVLTKEITDVIGKTNKVSVPKYFYKVILSHSSKGTKGIGFIFPHESSSKPVRDYAVTIDSVQKFTGFDFYYYLPDKKLEEKVEKTLCTDCWIW